MNGFHLHRSTVAKAAAKPASDLRDRVGQVVQEEQRILRRHQLSSVHHRPSQNVVVRRDEGRAKSPMRGNVGQDRFHRRIASEPLSVSGSAHRRPWVQTNTANEAEVRHLEVVNQRCRELMEDLRMKRAANRRGGRALKVSCRNNEVARLALRNAGRQRGNQKAAG